jgi:hypothetical protein
MELTFVERKVGGRERKKKNGSKINIIKNMKTRNAKREENNFFFS